ncbi:MAG: hypothetical protein KIT84_42700 [Labilithrix sp.]|nr:hypothetical protein [Labilithrix sp.]MCW5817788.1 hypothetical protein [Labilithrix sp.]
MRSLPILALCTLFTSLAACSSSVDDGAASQEAAQIADTQSIVQRPDGLFDVVCLDGRREVANQDEILANTVCAPTSGSSVRAIALSGGDGHACALGSDARVTCWGSDLYGQTEVPANLKAKAVAAGGIFSCAIRLDGSITCWGGGSVGQLDAPAGRFTTLTAGGAFACAIRESGELACWGYDGVEQTNAPPGRFTAVDARQLHACARSEQGRIECWGDELVDIPALAGSFVDHAVATVGTCGLTREQAISCVAAPGYTLAQQVPAGRFSKIAGGAAHACALASDGRIECWGGNNGLGELDVPAGRFADLTTGLQFSCGLRASGKVVCWGSIGNMPTPFPE